MTDGPQITKSLPSDFFAYTAELNHLHINKNKPPDVEVC